MIIGDLLI